MHAASFWFSGAKMSLRACRLPAGRPCLPCPHGGCPNSAGAGGGPRRCQFAASIINAASELGRGGLAISDFCTCFCHMAVVVTSFSSS